MKKKKILLIEDNQDDIILIQRAFNKIKLMDDFELIIKQDGSQALSYLFNHPTTLIFNQERSSTILLLDLKLPRMNGFEILQHIRSNEKTKLIPVIVFTSSKEDTDIIKAYEFGANSYIRKPIDSEKFTTVLEQIIRYWGEINELPQ